MVSLKFSHLPISINILTSPLGNRVLRGHYMNQVATMNPPTMSPATEIDQASLGLFGIVFIFDPEELYMSS